MFSIYKIPLLDDEGLVRNITPQLYAHILSAPAYMHKTGIHKFNLIKFSGVLKVYWDVDCLKYEYVDTIKNIKYLPTYPYNVYRKRIKLTLERFVELYMRGA